MQARHDPLRQGHFGRHRIARPRFDSSGPLPDIAPSAHSEHTNPDADKAKAWLAKGATPSATVESILKKAGVLSA